MAHRDVADSEDQRQRISVVEWHAGNRFLLKEFRSFFVSDDGLAKLLGSYGRVAEKMDDGKLFVQFFVEAECELLPGDSFRVDRPEARQARRCRQLAVARPEAECFLQSSGPLKNGSDMHKFTQLLGIVAIVFATPVCAEQWPSRLIRATIPFGAGSATDVVPRLVFDRLAAELGQPIVIENRAGAGGMLGTMQVAKADPDGYTVLAHSSALTIAPAIFPNLAFDPKDLVSVLMIGSSANVMIVPTSRPWKTIQDFIADAKSKPGTISFGSVGIGSAVHISAEKFRLAAGIEAAHVPYRGGSEVITDILGGRIDFYFCPLATALPLIKEGQVRALVVSTAERVADLPDVPTLARRPG